MHLNQHVIEQISKKKTLFVKKGDLVAELNVELRVTVIFFILNIFFCAFCTCWVGFTIS